MSKKIKVNYEGAVKEIIENRKDGREVLKKKMALYQQTVDENEQRALMKEIDHLSGLLDKLNRSCSALVEFLNTLEDHLNTLDAVNTEILTMVEQARSIDLV